MKCRDMIATVGTPERIDILAAVVDVKPIIERDVNGKSILLQECTVIHQDLQTIVLTLWGSFIDNQGADLIERKDQWPIILAQHLLPNNFSGLSLGTTSSSFILIDPHIPQAEELRTWTEDNATAITAMQQPNPQNLQHLVVYNPEEPITPVSEIVPDTKNPWVEGQLAIGGAYQQVTHTSCPGCM